MFLTILSDNKRMNKEKFIKKRTVYVIKVLDRE